MNFSYMYVCNSLFVLTKSPSLADVNEDQLDIESILMAIVKNR